MAHAAVKSLLFLGAGAWLAAYGTQQLPELHGAACRHRAVGTAVTVGALAPAASSPCCTAHAWGSLAGPAPRLAAPTAIAAFAVFALFAVFASLGLPGFSGFIAEFEIFAGRLGSAPVATELAMLGILVTAGLFLRGLHGMFLGPARLPEPLGRCGSTHDPPRHGSSPRCSQPHFHWILTGGGGHHSR